MAVIFIVDDDQAIGEMLSLVLENEGFQTVTCMDGLRAVEMFPTVKPDLILLDVMLPGLDGTEVARRIRETSNVPIIMLTAKSDTTDVVAGLEAGADDYVPKPFKVAELLARIRARFRIARPAAAEESGSSAKDATTNHIERGGIVIDRLEHTATKDGKDLGLTPMEFELLFVLSKAAGEAISRSTLLHDVWGYESSGDTRLVNVHVQRLRAKVEDDPENPQIIQTVRGIGYKYVTPEN
ncbi:response regulator transcription factor [Bifidobacterium imperatoris]|uniref:DNA-binding response regulator MtrA n=1 Tax=Bifidobacterium imperatoris TaxID=2020965 RepID=A0A2N5IU63_9BIFI|nr:MtrAB system response regulator MtrA [Bifidobacterium imperatoris]PLS25504.1 DNA-binding response regulator [Bifidobacterium imperatoris]QSY57078.1 response regulator transcription factor [Bifidobacterium imperatoris]